MKKCFYLFVLLAVLTPLVFAAGKPEAQSTSKSSTDADKAAIENLWTNYSKYAMEGNFDAFLTLHDRDAYKMPQNQPMFQIWVAADNVRTAWTNRVKNATMQMSIDPKEIVIMGDYAYSMGVYKQILTPKAGGASTTFDGKFLTLLHKDSSGNWKILRDCYNSNTPPAQ